MPNLPHEIWLHVANYLSDGELNRLLGLNHVFLNIVLDRQWKHMRFSTAALSYYVLKRLSDPFIAKRIETMHITLYIESKYSWKRHFKPITSLLTQFRDASVIRDAIDFIHNRSESARHSSRATLTHVINTLHAITPLLININEITIMTSYSLSYSLSYPLLRNILSSFSGSSGSSLRRLSLEGTLDEFSTLLGSNPMFCSLEELNLVFKETPPTHSNWDINLLSTIVAPFINCLSCHLQVLSIKSYFALDLSHFFTALTIFPILRKLDVRTAFHKTHCYPESLIDFITNHTHTLLDLGLPLIPFQRFSPDLDLHEALKVWLERLTGDGQRLTRLQRLEIYPTKTTAGLAILLTCIERASVSLREIHIRGRFFSPFETSLIIDTLSLCNNLQSLCFNTCRLEVQLFDALAAKLPQVERIVMMIESDFQEDHSRGIAPSFPEGMEERSYISWNLKHLQVKPRGGVLDTNILYALARSIPSLRFLGENGVYVFPKTRTEPRV